MSWWNPTAGLGSLASQALKNAQAKIDTALDIQGEEDNSPDEFPGRSVKLTDSPDSPTSPSATRPKSDDGEFWKTWLPADKLATLKGSSPEKPDGSFSTDFLKSTLSASLSKIKSLQKKEESPAPKNTSPSLFFSTPSGGSTSPADTKLEKASTELPPTATGSILYMDNANIGLSSDEGRVGVRSQSPASDDLPAYTHQTPVMEPLQIVVPQEVIHEADSQMVGLLTNKAPSPCPSDIPAVEVSPCVPVGLSGAESEGDTGELSSEDERLLTEPDPRQSDWGDVSLSILTESQISSASSAVTDITDAVVPRDTTSPGVSGEVTIEEPFQNLTGGEDKVDSSPHKSELEEPMSVTVSEPQSDKVLPPECVQDSVEEEKPQSDPSCDKVEPTLDTISTNIPHFSFQTTTPTPSDSIISENAWDIPELTESALVVDGSVDSLQSSITEPTLLPDTDSPPPPYQSEDTPSYMYEDPGVLEIATHIQTVEDTDKTVELEASSWSADSSVPAMSSMEGSSVPATSSMESSSVPATSSMEGSSVPVTSSMEGSTETQEELSDSNRTLTCDDLDNPRLSSESSQATLELSPEDQQLGETSDEESRPETVTPTGEHSPSKSQLDDKSKDTLTSSSYVKNMLEEAMVESTKDTDSRTDSQSSSEMVRIESGPTSGHTSADEIETNTSSDIEIISHISTPTPNGESRLFDLSPLRHALSRTMRRNSPPGHKRSDSSSSGQSRNGEELLSPDGTPRSVLEASMRREARKQAAAEADSSSNALETEKLLKKLAETAEILDVRERKLVELSRENMEVVETNNILRQQLQQSEEARDAEMADLNMLSEEFTKRMGEAEMKIQGVIREKEVTRKKLQDTESELVKRSNDKATERIMREKDQQISELLEEGEKLSKQQLQSNNNIKKLRVKEKENESLLKTQKTKLDEQKAEIERLQKILDAKMEIEKKQIDAINQLNNAVLTQEAEIISIKSETEDSTERIRSMQVALDNSYKEIGELHKANASKASQAQEAALSAEIKARADLQVALEQNKQLARHEQENLLTEIEDLQLSLSRMEKEQGRREDILKQEISDLQQRLQEGDDRNQDLTNNVSQATRPLLRQIENIQSTYAAQSASYEKVERNLTERLSDAQTQLALAQDKERGANDRVIEVDVKLFMLETQVSQLRQDKSKLQAGLEIEKAKLEVLEDARSCEIAQSEAIKVTFVHENSELKKDKKMLENQQEMEKLRTEAEKKKVTMLHEQLREKELQWVQSRKPASSPTPQFSRESSFTVESPINLSQHEEVLEKTLLLASANGSKTSLYESLRQAGATTIVESLQSQLKMKEGEISQLQTDIQELERTRESMGRELVSLTTSNDDLQNELREFPLFQAKFKDLEQRYNALLQMYGEKVEEAQELRLDLQDVKDLYKQQINELLRHQ